MNPLIALLSQVAGTNTGVNPDLQGTPYIPPSYDGEYQGQIDVTAGRDGAKPTAKYDDYVLNNAPAVLAREQDIKQTEEASDRRGMFGTRGTLRDILGVLGDAFLVQSGNNPMYAPTRRREQISDAQAGWTVDPVAAAERVGYYDPAMGQEILTEAQNTELRRAQQESLQASRQSLSDDRSFKQYERARAQIGSLFNTPGAVVDGQISPQAVALAERIANSAGMSLEEFMINEGMSEEDVRNYAMSVIDPYKQERLEDYDTGLAQGQQNADSRRISAEASRTRANRPPASRAAPQPTRASMLAEIMRIPASQRTREQQDFLVRETQPSSSSARNRPSTSSRFRPVSN